MGVLRHWRLLGLAGALGRVAVTHGEVQLHLGCGTWREKLRGRSECVPVLGRESPELSQRRRYSEGAAEEVIAARTARQRRCRAGGAGGAVVIYVVALASALKCA